MTDFSSLIERVESGEGPDLELDARIDAALFGGRAALDFTEGTRAARLRYSYGANVVFDHTNPGTNGGFVLSTAFRYAAPVTSSLGAVTGLIDRVLPGWDWCLYRDNGEAIAGVSPPSEDGCDWAHRHAASPARALLSALLRAVSERNNDGTPLPASPSDEGG